MIPSYDLKTLYVARDLGNSLQAIDPTTGRPSGRRIHVPDPCNMYFTPDGRYAITVAELLKRLDFRDAHTMALVRSRRFRTAPPSVQVAWSRLSGSVVMPIGTERPKRC